MKYFLYRLSTLKVHLIVVCLMSLASYPLICTALSDCYDRSYELQQIGQQFGYASDRYFAASQSTDLGKIQSSAGFISLIGLFVLAMLILSGFFIVCHNFRWLYDKNHADMAFTLPVTADNRFWGDFLSGLAVYVVPHILSALTGIAIVGDRELFYPRDNTRDHLFYGMLVSVLICILFYCMTVFIFSFCGRLKKNIALTIFLNIAVPVITLSSVMISFHCGWGTTQASSSEWLGHIGFTSPISLFIGYLEARGSRLFSMKYTPVSVLIVLVYSAAIAYAAYFLVKHRRAERTGNPYVFRHARTAVSTTGVLAVTAVGVIQILSSYESIVGFSRTYMITTVLEVSLISIGAFLAAAFIVYAICEFSDRNKEPKLKKTARFPLVVVICAAAVGAVSLTQGFGAAFYVPDADSVERVYCVLDIGRIRISGDVDDIKQFTGLHSRLIGPEADTDNYISFNYTITGGNDKIKHDYDGGKYINRIYHISREQARDAFETIKSAGLIKQFYTIERSEKDLEKSRDSIEVWISGYSPGREEYSSVKQAKGRVVIPFDDLQNALYEDAENMTFEQAFADKTQGGVFPRVSVDNWLTRTFTLPTYFEKTSELLAQYGLALYEDNVFDEDKELFRQTDSPMIVKNDQ